MFVWIKHNRTHVRTLDGCGVSLFAGTVSGSSAEVRNQEHQPQHPRLRAWRCLAVLICAPALRIRDIERVTQRVPYELWFHPRLDRCCGSEVSKAR